MTVKNHTKSGDALKHGVLVWASGDSVRYLSLQASNALASVAPHQSANAADAGSDDDYAIDEEFLLKPGVLSDEDGWWGVGDGAAAVEAGDAKNLAAAPASSEASTVPKDAPLLPDLPSVIPLGDEFRWPNIRVGPLGEPIEARLSHLDCSSERLVVYVHRAGASGEDLLAELRAALHAVYSQVSFAQYKLDIAAIPSWTDRPVVFKSDGIWRRGRVLQCVDEQELLHLLDVDTGVQQIAALSQVRPVFESSPPSSWSRLTGLINSTPPLALPVRLWDLYPTDPDQPDSEQFRDWQPYQLTIRNLLAGKLLRVHIVRMERCRVTREPLLASTVLLPSSQEVGEALIEGLPLIDRDGSLFKVAYRYDRGDIDRQFLSLVPPQPACYPSIGLPPSGELCPVGVVQVGTVPAVVSLQLLDLDDGGQPESQWRRLVNETYQSLVCGKMQQELQLKGPRQPCLPDEVRIPCACLARYSHDQLWYRAELLPAPSAADGRQMVTVYYVDFGNTELMDFAASAHRLRQPLLLDAPCLAVRCRLQRLVRHPRCSFNEVPTDQLCSRVLRRLMSDRQRLWLLVRRRYSDGVRLPDVELFDDAGLSQSANRRLIESGLMALRADYPDDAAFESGFELA